MESKLTVFHGFKDSVRWRVTPEGVEVEGTGVERSRGAPATATRVWNDFGDSINRTARARRVPCALIVATICTESSGRADAVRLEPGYISDERTPHRVSPGLMQTLISTAREAMQMSFGRDWLLVPGNSIEAGTAYIAQQARLTCLDPPLVAAAYNAGRLAHQTGAQNRWKLRQFPIGTGKHCDRFVQFFNDAVAVLAAHRLRAAVGLEVLLGETRPAPSVDPARTPAGRPVSITFAANAREADVTPYSRTVLEDTLRAASLEKATVSSTLRGPADQARVMYNNLEQFGVAHQKALYGKAGDQVIDTYARSKALGKAADDIKRDMEAKIRELGPTNVSRHASDPKVLNVFDVSPKSIADHAAFERAARADRRVTTFLTPPKDPGYHFEIPQPRG